MSTRLTLATWLESHSSFPYFQIEFGSQTWTCGLKQGQALLLVRKARASVHGSDTPVLPKGTHDHFPAYLHTGGQTPGCLEGC